MRADGVDAVMAGHPVVGVERRQELEAGLGPRTMATATAWLSVTIGFGEIVASSSYSARIWRQSVSSARGASSWTAAIAAWS